MTRDGELPAMKQGKSYLVNLLTSGRSAMGIN